MAGCQDSSQLRVTYITNDCRLTKCKRSGKGGGRIGDQEKQNEEERPALVRARERGRFTICWWSDAPGVASFVKPSICRSRGSITIF